MSKAKKEFVIRPEDSAFHVLNAAVALVKEMLRSGVRVSVVVSKWVPAKTPPQHRTVFLWCKEAAVQLNIMGELIGGKTNWTTEDAYEFVFKERFMPKRMAELPGGEILFRPIGLSDKDATLEAVSEAMTKFQVWACETGIELTQTDGDHNKGVWR